jgi:aromatic-L-amino-acid decarboxylase
MDDIDFREWSSRAAIWSANYLETLSDRPVKAQVAPGEIVRQIENSPPEAAESMDKIFSDFEDIIPNGMTHWQHPRFFAYFPGNAAPAGMIAEQLAGALAAQCMLWQTSPAATELETKMVDWLRQSFGLPVGFYGVLQESASAATLCSTLVMRERALKWKGNETGLSGQRPVRIYASTQTHSSIDKATWIAGIGQDNLVKIPTDDSFAIDIEALRSAIKQDRENGFLPAGIIICVGGTSIGAIDNIEAVCAVAKEENLYTHVDAAWAGSAMICPEFRHLWKGVENADSVVINPHKWLGAPQECSAHFVKKPELLTKTLSIQPEYLKTYNVNGIVNFSEWSIQLGRRFRALKVWFLLRAYGQEGLRSRIRNHVAWAQGLAARLDEQPDFEISTKPVLSLFSFRYIPGDNRDPNALNQQLVDAINGDGRIYLTQTNHDGKIVIRFVAGTFNMTIDDRDVAFRTIVDVARNRLT